MELGKWRDLLLEEEAIALPKSGKHFSFHFSVIKEGLASSSESLTAGTSTTISPTKHFIKIYDSGVVAFVVASLSILEFCELTLERTSRVK